MARPRPSNSAQPRIVYQEFGPVATESEPEVVDVPPQQQNVRIQASRAGRKGKTVTVVTGLQLSPATMQSLLKVLKGVCGSGGTIKEQTLEIQGDQRQKILDCLLEKGYKAKISGG